MFFIFSSDLGSVNPYGSFELSLINSDDFHFLTLQGSDLNLKSNYAKNLTIKFFLFFSKTIIFAYVCQIRALHINLKKNENLPPLVCIQ